MKWEDEDLTDAGVVEDRKWSGLVAGACGIGALVTVLVFVLVG